MVSRGSSQALPRVAFGDHSQASLCNKFGWNNETFKGAPRAILTCLQSMRRHAPNLRHALPLSRGDWSVLVTIVLLPAVKSIREEAFVEEHRSGMVT